MSCTNPKHPAIQHDGTYCCDAATKALSHEIFFEPLNRDGRQLNYEEAIRSIFTGGGVRREGQ